MVVQVFQKCFLQLRVIVDEPDRIVQIVLEHLDLVVVLANTGT